MLPHVITDTGFGVHQVNVKAAFGLTITSATVEHINFITLGVLIIFFLIVEPNGLARLWQVGKQKLRVWPFPY